MPAWDPRVPPILVGKVNQDLKALTDDVGIKWLNTYPPNEASAPGWDQWKRMLITQGWNP